MGKTNKRRGIPSMKVKRIQVRVGGDYPLRRCETCFQKSKMVMKDVKTGEVERIVNCKTTCMYAKGVGLHV